MKIAEFFGFGTADPFRKWARLAVVVGSTCAVVVLSCAPANSESAVPDKSATKAIKPEDFKTDTSKPFLRVDFQLTGVSCVTCVRDVAKNLKHGKGIVKADVSIFPPHWSVAIIDTKTSSVSQVVKLVRKARADVASLESVSLDSVPVIVVPKPSKREEPHT